MGALGAWGRAYTGKHGGLRPRAGSETGTRLYVLRITQYAAGPGGAVGPSPVPTHYVLRTTHSFPKGGCAHEQFLAR